MQNKVISHSKMILLITTLNKKSTITQELRITQKKLMNTKNSDQNIVHLFFLNFFLRKNDLKHLKFVNKIDHNSNNLFFSKVFKFT